MIQVAARACGLQGAASGKYLGYEEPRVGDIIVKLA